MKYRLAIPTGLMLVLLGTTSASSQTCRPLDDTGKVFQYLIGTYSGANPGTPEDASRIQLRLDAVPANQVVLVTQQSTCNKANTAYHNKLSGAGAGFSNQVYVLQVGTKYAVVDPAFYVGPAVTPHNWVTVILDSHFKVVGEF